MARAGHPPLHTLSPAQARLAYARGADVLELPAAPLARVENLAFTARDGVRLALRLYAAAPGPLPVLLFFHGGGFCIGSIDTHDILCRELSRRAGCVVLSLDYRLAPEHRFPQAVDDAWDALGWLVSAGAALGLDTRRMAVGGDSAGGTLAAVCALMARDARLHLALQLLFYPGCAAQADSASHRRYASGYLLDALLIDWFFDHYIAPEHRTDWRFAPLLAPDHAGVAPAWIGLAECDPLVDEGIEYGDRLRAAGVAVELEIYRGVTHEFIKMGRTLPQAPQSHADAAAALRRAFFA